MKNNMRTIQSIKNEQLNEALDFIKKVFTDSEGEESGTLVMNLVKEIRSKKYYLPELELVMVDENNEIIGYEYINLNNMMRLISNGKDVNSAYEESIKTYGRFDDAVKYINPRKE